jgi:hypothetical protein
MSRAGGEARTDALWRSVLHDLAALEEITGQPFPPDGHMVGSMGAVLAARRYGLTLMPPSTHGYDALDADGRTVEIKATRRSSVSLSASGPMPHRLVVVRLLDDGDPEWVYDGPAAPAWQAARAANGRGQRVIGLAALRRLAASSLAPH